ncbi:hypothetical protein AAMO2058_000426600 [Amorphochlora amoebiformis]|mmetsp:Transcript_10575/g.16728  ORF Transcript_10575/g.16728 Transcript_10575/m.16728 type:complete len:350 (-) Transcript_10575:60-1109(-)
MGQLLCGVFHNPREDNKRRLKRVVVGTWLGVDLGATSTKVGVVSDAGQIMAMHLIPHEGKMNPIEVVRRIKECCLAALSKAEVSLRSISGIGIGAPGSIRNGLVVKASNFPTWENVPLADLVSKSLGIRLVKLHNDADAAIAAESWVGAAVETSADSADVKNSAQNIVLITLGTGIGCGMIIDGHLVKGGHGVIEGGHHIVHKDGKLCPCGQRGCMEMYCSAPAVVSIAQEVLSKTKPSESKLESQQPLTCKKVFEAALLGDAAALEVVDTVAEYLAVGCINFMRIVDPEVIVLTGGVTHGKSGQLLLDQVKSHISKQTWTCLPTPARVILAKTEHTGIIGSVAAAHLS